MSNPGVTLTVFTYNQERYVKESIESALAQDYSPLTIVISDDCSTDKTFEIIQETVKNYKGPHKIILNRNEKNMGLIDHFNYIIKNFVKTDIFVVQAGDDISMSNRTSKLIREINKDKKIYAAFSNVNLIDEEGNVLKHKFLRYESGMYSLQDIILRPIILGASAAYKIDVFKKFGNIRSIYEDWELSIRASLLGMITYINVPLVKYRIHDTNVGLSKIKLLHSNVRNYKKLKREYYRELKFILTSLIQKMDNTNQDAKKIVLYSINFLELMEEILNSSLINKVLLLSKILRLYIQGKKLKIKNLEKELLISMFPELIYWFKKIRGISKIYKT